MKFWILALTALAIGWSGPALAAISPGCRVMADSANRANLAARGGFASLFETRAAPADDHERQQRLADAADAVLLGEAARTICAGPDDAAPARAVAKDVAEHQAAVTAALAAGDCLPVLAAAQNRLVELARGMEAGAVDPAMTHVLGGALAVNTQVRAKCSGDAVTLAAALAEQGAALRTLYDSVSICQPVQARYQLSLQRAAAMIPEASREVYDRFLREDYEPALAAVKTSCAGILNAELIDGNEAKMRDFAALKEEAQKAMARPNPAVAP